MIAQNSLSWFGHPPPFPWLQRSVATDFYGIGVTSRISIRMGKVPPNALFSVRLSVRHSIFSYVANGGRFGFFPEVDVLVM